jgi:hypothetical protein
MKMEENNVETGMAEQKPNFDGHPTQAHADHAAIMKAHEVIQDPQRMAGVHALHKSGGGLIAYLEKKKKDFATKEAQQSAASNPGHVAHEESPAADKDSDMSPNPLMSAGAKKSIAIQ